MGKGFLFVSEYNPMQNDDYFDRVDSPAGHTAKYYRERGCRFDVRGTLKIDPSSRWGFYVTVITLSHQRSKNDVIHDGALVDRPVIVGPDAWICSNATLYNCIIGEGAIVSVGAVVRSQEVKPFVMVAGNPARVIARYIAGEWRYTGRKYEVLE
jgi:acetyltransferase-like isoleucine patch superfamily enzyme